MTVRAGHDSYWNSHAGFSGTYASQFAVTGLSAVKGATEELAVDIRRLAAGVLRRGRPGRHRARGRLREAGATTPRRRCRSSRVGAIINANNAAIPEELRDITLNKRYVYVPPFELPDLERKYGNLTLTYATQVHVAVVEVDPETGVYELVDYAAVDDCGTRIHPQIVEGQVMGAAAHGIGAATHETFTYDEEGNLLTPELLRLPRAARDGPAAAEDGRDRVAVAVHAARHEGHGRGRRRRDPRDLRRAPGRAQGRRRADRLRLVQPAPPGLGADPGPGREPRERVEVVPGVKVEGERTLAAPREVVWGVLNDPRRWPALIPGVAVVRGPGRPALEREGARSRSASARSSCRSTSRRSEERELEFASLSAKGNGVGAMINMQTSVHARAGRRRGTRMLWAADVSVAGPVGSMGQRVLQPIVKQQVNQVLGALEKQVAAAQRSRRRRAAASPMAPPFRIGVMQLTMEPLAEMLETARALDRGGFDTIWLAEAYPWWRKHGMEARSSTAVSSLMARDTERLTIAWGIVSAYTRHPVQAAMDARVVQEAAGPGRFIAGFGTSKIFLNNTKQGGPPKETKPLAHMRDSVAIVRGALSGKRFEYDGKVFSADLPALQPEADAPDWDVPVYVAATAPLMQQLGGEIGDGLLTPSITTPAFVEYTRGNVRKGAAKAGPRPGAGRRRLHDRRVDRRRRPRPRPRRRARDRRHVPREQVPEHPRLGRHAAAAGRDRDGGARAGRRGDGAGRPAGGEGAGDATRCSTAASRSPARPPTASARSRSTGPRAART